MSPTLRLAKTLSTAQTFRPALPAFSSSSRAIPRTLIQNTFTRNFQTTISKMVVHNIGSKKDFDATLKENEIVVMDCFATWCGPCKVIAPKVVTFSDTYSKAHFIKLDVDEVPDVAQELGIRAMPTFLIFKNGEKVGEVVGANPKALEGAITKAVEE